MNKNNENGSGYKDPTATSAINHADKETERETERFYKLLFTILTLCTLARFHVVGRIELRDKRTGKTWN